ncbi:MAG: 30S ribosome-binding factor RbfA [Verrucomicrobiota bacterium]
MSQRIARVNELMKREISACIEKSFEFPGILVTIHEVSTSPDLKSAQVFVGVIGDSSEAAKVADQLNGKRGFIQSVVMKRVVLKNTPQLRFVVDDSVERGVRVLNILDEIGDIDLPSDVDSAESGGKG